MTSAALLAQRIIALACGYEDLNDHRTLRTDPALQTAAGCAPTPTRRWPPRRRSAGWRTAFNREALIQISATLVDQFLTAHPRPPEALILDFDVTDDPVHGKQEDRFFHGYYDTYLRTDSASFTFYRHIIAHPVTLRTATTSLRL